MSFIRRKLGRCREETRQLLVRFVERYDVTDWKDYLRRISGLSFSILQKEKDGHIELNIAKDEKFTANTTFLDKLAAVKYDELTDSDFKTARERPLHRVSEGRY